MSRFSKLLDNSALKRAIESGDFVKIDLGHKSRIQNYEIEPFKLFEYNEMSITPFGMSQALTQTIFNEPTPKVFLGNTFETYSIHIFDTIRQLFVILSLNDEMEIEKSSVQETIEEIDASLNGYLQVFKTVNIKFQNRDKLMRYIESCLDLTSPTLLFERIANNEAIQKSPSFHMSMLTRLFFLRMSNLLGENCLLEIGKICLNDMLNLYLLVPFIFDPSNIKHSNHHVIFILSTLIFTLRKANIDVWNMVDTLFQHLRDVDKYDGLWGFIFTLNLYSTYNDQGKPNSLPPLKENWNIILYLLKGQLFDIPVDQKQTGSPVRSAKKFQNNSVLQIIDRCRFLKSYWQENYNQEIINIFMDYFLGSPCLDSVEKDNSFAEYLSMLEDFIVSSNNQTFQINRVITFAFTRYGRSNTNSSELVQSTKNVMSIINLLFDYMTLRQRDSLIFIIKGKINFTSQPLSVKKVIIEVLFLLLNKLVAYPDNSTAISKGHEELSKLLVEIFKDLQLNLIKSIDRLSQQSNALSALYPNKKMKSQEDLLPENSEGTNIKQYCDRLGNLIFNFINYACDLYQNHETLPSFMFINSGLRSLLSDKESPLIRTLRKVTKKLVFEAVCRTLLTDKSLDTNYYSKELSKYLVEGVYPECQTILSNTKNSADLLYIATDMIAIMSPIFTKSFTRTWDYYFREYCIHGNSNLTWIGSSERILRFIPLRFVKSLLMVQFKVLDGDTLFHLPDGFYLNMLGVWINSMTEEHFSAQGDVLKLLSKSGYLRTLKLFDGIKESHVEGISKKSTFSVQLASHILSIVFENLAIYLLGLPEFDFMELKETFTLAVKYLPHTLHEHQSLLLRQYDSSLRTKELKEALYTVLSKALFELPYFFSTNMSSEWNMKALFDWYYLSPIRLLMETKDIPYHHSALSGIPLILQGISLLDFRKDNMLQEVLFDSFLVFLNSIVGHSREGDIQKLRTIASSFVLLLPSKSLAHVREKRQKDLNGLREFLLSEIFSVLLENPIDNEICNSSVLILTRFLRLLFNHVGQNISTDVAFMDFNTILGAVHNCLSICDPLKEGVLPKFELYSFLWEVYMSKIYLSDIALSDSVHLFIKDHIVPIIMSDMLAFLNDSYEPVDLLVLEPKHKHLKAYWNKPPRKYVSKTELNFNDDETFVTSQQESLLKKIFKFIDALDNTISIKLNLKKVKNLIEMKRSPKLIVETLKRYIDSRV